MDMRSFNKKSLTQQELTSLNETESFFELIAEELFDVDIPETDEPDIEKNKQVLVFFCCELTAVVMPSSIPYQSDFALYTTFIKDIVVATDDHPPNKSC